MALRELEERARTALSAQRGEVTRLEAEISKQLDAITTAITEHRSTEEAELQQANDARSELERLRADTTAAQAAWNLERASQESDLAKLRQELQQLTAEHEEQVKQLAELRAELDARQSDLEKQSGSLARRQAELDQRAEEFKSSRDQREAAHENLGNREAAWEAERLLFETKQDELLKKLAAVEADQRASKDAWQDELVDFERKLQDQKASWDEQRDEWNTARAKIERERDELQQKFELALQDVQRFRGRAADLEQDLARRPETNAADSAELVGLRAERDALAERIEQLERQPVTQADANSQQQMADLQRRFELAVEDVRELKTKNAALESRLANASSRSAGPADGGGMDWESQKRRMLASLADETGDGDEVSEKERATIEGTIEMTDAVVAEKDREIQELKSQLATLNSETAQTAKDNHDDDVNELLDADSVIAEHRKRIALIEREMEDKLRTAELEMSVERAKIARQKVELEELRSDLDARRQSNEAAGGGGTPGAPRRRWLSKLGLSGEE
jgi:chromosome segregation ATPase